MRRDGALSLRGLAPCLWGLPARLVRRRAVRGGGEWRERPPLRSACGGFGEGELVRQQVRRSSPSLRGSRPPINPCGKAG